MDNATYTLTDNIVGFGPSIVVERDNIVVDGSGFLVDGINECLYPAIDLSGRRNVSVRNMRIHHFESVFWLHGSSHNKLSANEVTSLVRAGAVPHGVIDLRVASNNTISNNKITTLTNAGIRLYSSSHNTISENNLFSIMPNSGQAGIMLALSNYNNILGNNIANKSLAISLGGSYNMIFGNNMANNDQVMFASGTHNSICDNDIVNNNHGIELDTGSNFKISGNKITNSGHGIWLSSACSNFSIFGNEITDCSNGIGVVESDYNSVSENDITSCGNGISLIGTPTHNRISGNNVTLCANGIYIQLLPLPFQLNNSFYSNNLVDNTKQVQISSDSLDISWNNSYPTGGNFWSDYSDVDLFSGPHQDLPRQRWNMGPSLRYR